MAKRQVRHALITYAVDERLEMAFRGQTVDISDEEARRFDALGATVPVDAELDRPGTLQALPESPTDEEVVAWVVAASKVELEHTLLARPELGPRIEGAFVHVKDARKAQDDALKAASKSISGSPTVARAAKALGNSAMLEDTDVSTSPHPVGSTGTPDAPDGAVPYLPGPDGENGPLVTVLDPSEKHPEPVAGTTTFREVEVHGSPGDEPDMPNTTAEVEADLLKQDADAPDGRTEAYVHVGDDTADAEAVQSVIYKSVDDVAEFVSDKPHLAEQVLSAEKANQALLGKEPRKGVVKAVEAAQAHGE